MKTFLWTTLFWIVVAIAWLLCLGFGNLGTQVVSNSRLARVMPENIQAQTCDTVVAQALENIDRCAAAENAECNLVTSVESGDLKWIQESLAVIVANQETIFNQMNESFASLQNVSADDVASENKVSAEELKKQQQKLELQAQIEALQAEMANL